MHNRRVILYTRKACCLCDEAKATLEKYGLQPQLVDIDDHPDKLAEYNECVPVVEIDGKQIGIYVLVGIEIFNILYQALFDCMVIKRRAGIGGDRPDGPHLGPSRRPPPGGSFESNRCR